MIKVLQFTDVINRYDFIDTIIQFADRERFEISVCRRTKESNIATPEFTEGTNKRVIGWSGLKGVPRAAWKLSRLLDEWDIDIVHAHHFEPAQIAWLASRIRRKTKFIFGRHYSDLIRNLPGVKRKVYLAAEQLMNRSAARIIVPSTMIANILVGEQNVDRSKIDVVPYGFASSKYSDIAEEERQAVSEQFGMEGKFIVVTLGKLTQGKGVRFLADAVVTLKNKIPDLMLVYVGEGEERRYLEELIGREGLEETIKIAGWRTDSMAFVAASDIVVQPTLSEAFSQVMGEAMWMGKPLVITDVSGATDIIRNGNGILVPKGDSRALAAAIETLYFDPELRERVGNAGKQFVKSELAIENVIELYERSYLDAVA
jgi:glycosyltransferase involved in cell wall biosynthesis